MSRIPNSPVEMDDALLLPPIDRLPLLSPQFFVPTLTDKPQNPILRSIDLMSKSRPKPITKTIADNPTLPPELAILAHDMHQQDQNRVHVKSVWEDAIVRDSQLSCHMKTWDRLRSSFNQKSYLTPFISEQSDQVFASAQYHIQPLLASSPTNVTYVTQDDLLTSLKILVLGTSSYLYTWDMASETFVRAGLERTVTHSLLIDGKNDVLSRSFLQRFLNIGTLVRRLEIFINYLRTRDGSTIHAFAHALSATLAYIRKKLITLTQNVEDTQPISSLLSAIWLRYGDFEDSLASISSLCCRELQLSPEQYPTFDTSTVPLLNRIYEHLNLHIERSSPRTITALFAYLLMKSSRDYIQRICQFLAFGNSVKQVGLTSKPVLDSYSSNIFAENDLEDEGGDAVSMDAEDECPAFIPPDLATILPAARKSLKLLLAARPDHPILTQSAESRALVWLWTESEIRTAYPSCTNDNKGMVPSDELPAKQAETKVVESIPHIVYKPELTQFRLFDLEPGSCQQGPLFGPASENLTDGTLQTFISDFPEALPSIVPNLDLLTSLVFSPLIKHAASLSQALLSLFLDPSSELYLHDHLTLLRSYMLLTSDSFKSRLAATLFSDSDEREPSNESVRAFSLSRRRHKPNTSKNGPWAVGLAPALAGRDSWPPGGADLSYILRTVIMDSVETASPPSTYESENEQKSGRQLIVSEAEYRLGFAIRDLPTGGGRDQWLNPLSIEALDFLYLDYKAPHPLDVIITPDILSKYQRVFAFLLRLMRVESAVRAVFRMTRKGTEPLFPTFTPTNKLFLHLRLMSQTFVNELSTYVYDVAIGGNYDVFLSRIIGAQSSGSPESDDVFSDVFTLTASHSMVLDDVLSACLLRSGQRAVGDLLRKTLEIILEFSILVGDIHSGRLEEYRAVPLLEDLYQVYHKKMFTLVQVLQALLEKGSKSSQLQREILLFKNQESEVRHPPGGMESLSHLLSRINVSGWWKGTDRPSDEI